MLLTFNPEPSVKIFRQFIDTRSPVLSAVHFSSKLCAMEANVINDIFRIDLIVCCRMGSGGSVRSNGSAGSQRSVISLGSGGSIVDATPAGLYSSSTESYCMLLSPLAYSFLLQLLKLNSHVW